MIFFLLKFAVLLLVTILLPEDVQFIFFGVMIFMWIMISLPPRSNKVEDVIWEVIYLLENIKDKKIKDEKELEEILRDYLYLIEEIQKGGRLTNNSLRELWSIRRFLLQKI